jgi:surface antigen
MQQIVFRTSLLFTALLLGGCATNPPMYTPPPQPTSIYEQPPQLEPLAPPAQSTVPVPGASDVSAYMDPTAYSRLSQAARDQAAGAQFNALQYGRVGAPRAWQADGASGSVTVGPFVRVNLIDCRDFTNAVTISGTTYTKKGTACRDASGSWSLAASKAG